MIKPLPCADGKEFDVEPLLGHSSPDYLYAASRMIYEAWNDAQLPILLSLNLQKEFIGNAQVLKEICIELTRIKDY